MKRGTRFVVQTINMSNPKTCVKPRAVQKPVDMDTPTDSKLAYNHWTPPRPVTVKVCTRKDMQKFYKSQCCDYREKPPPSTLSTGERLYRIVMFFIKGTIAASLIYWTYAEGFWSDGEEAENLWNRIMSTIAPWLPAPPSGVDDIHLSHLERIKYSILEAYNDVVMKSMDIIVGAPLEVYRQLGDIMFPCDVIKETRAEQSDKKI